MENKQKFEKLLCILLCMGMILHTDIPCLL